MLASTAWVWSWGSRLRLVSWRNVAATIFWLPTRAILPVSGSFILVSAAFPLDPGQRGRHGAVVRVDDPVVAADQRGDGDGLGRAEGEIAAGAVQDLAVPAAPPELLPRAVRHPAFEDRPEGVGVDRALQAELLPPPLPAQALASRCSGSSFA